MKCIICDKEFPNNVDDYELLLHVRNEHRKEFTETANNIKKNLKRKL